MNRSKTIVLVLLTVFVTGIFRFALAGDNKVKPEENLVKIHFKNANLAGAFQNGTFSFEIAGFERIDLSGAFKEHVHGFDLALYLMKEFGDDEFKGKIIEFTGDSMMDIPMAERFKLCHFATEMGALSAIIATDERSTEYVKRRSESNWDLFTSDDDAYSSPIKVDLSNVEVLIRIPGGDIKTVEEISGQTIDMVYIGSDAGGYYDDVMLATNIMKGRGVQVPLQLLVIPNTRGAYAKVMDNGQMGLLIGAGANVAFPTAGPFVGQHTGVLGPGQIGLATYSQNAVGQMGDPESKVYLASSAGLSGSSK